MKNPKKIPGIALDKNRNRTQEFIKNPKKALFLISYPIAIGMVVQSLYEFVDTAFVGKLGVEAIAALTFSFPLFYILIAFNSGITAGMGSRISRFLGEKNRIEAENTAIHGIIISLIVSVIVYTIGFVTLKNLFTLFGAEGDVLNLSLGYMQIILLGIFFIFPSYALSSVFISQGNTRTTMKVQISSLVFNIILDPILIYALGLGIKGAAIATVLAFLVSLVLYIYYIRKESYIRLRWESFHYSKKIVWEILKVGTPATLVLFLLSAYIVLLNRFMAFYGNQYVAAFGLSSQIESIAIIPIVAFSSSLMTLVGMFFGAKKFGLLKSINWYGMKATILITSILGAIVFISAPLLFRIFTNNQELIGLSVNYMRIDVFTFPLMGIVAAISRVMQGIGKGMPGLLVNFIRIFVFTVPLSFVFVYVLGYSYLWVAVSTVIGGFLSSVFGILWLRRYLKKLA